MEDHRPIIDLTQLTREVLSRGPKAVLPCNLSDKWLELISYSFDKVLQGKDEDSGKYISAPITLIGHLLLGKSGITELQVDAEDLFEYFRKYRLELALEEVSRRSDIKAEAATLETIFTDRNVNFAAAKRGR